MGARAEDNPGVVAQPPYILLGFLAFGLALDAVWPLGLGLGGAEVPAGIALFALGVFGTSVAIRQFATAGTSHRTRDPATALVSRGLYRHSRNPIYIALLVAYLGIGMATDSPAVLALAIPALAVIRLGVIAREERYLEAKFGAEYSRYRAAVRRWL